MFRKLLKTLPGALGIVLIVAGLTLANSNRHGIGNEITYDEGVISTIKDTGEAIVQTQRGLQYTVQGNGWKVGEKVQCTTQDGDTVCERL